MTAWREAVHPWAVRGHCGHLIGPGETAYVEVTRPRSKVTADSSGIPVPTAARVLCPACAEREMQHD